MNTTIVLGGWAVGPEILEPLFGSQACYIDVNAITEDLVAGERIRDDWIQRVRRVVHNHTGGVPIDMIAGWSTGAIMALGLIAREQPRTAVLLSVTPSFCRREGWRMGQRARVVQSMIEALDVDSAMTLERFYRLCGFASPPGCGYSTGALKAGLRFLEQVAVEIPQLPTTKIVVMHGKSDQIVPVAAGRFTADTSGASFYEYDAGHTFFENTMVRSVIAATVNNEEQA